MGASHIVVEKGGGGYILGGRGRFWEGRTYEFVEKGVAYYMRGRGRFWEGRTYEFVEKGMYSEREEGVDSERVAWLLKRGVDSGREG